jgi:hypothetical protein
MMTLEHVSSRDITRARLLLIDREQLLGRSLDLRERRAMLAAEFPSWRSAYLRDVLARVAMIERARSPESINAALAPLRAAIADGSLQQVDQDPEQ